MAGPAIASGDNREIAVSLRNVTDEPRRGRLDVNLPVGWEGPEPRRYDLGPGEQLDWTPTVRAAVRVAPSYDLVLRVHRAHDGSPWATETVPFGMVPVTHWRIETPDGTEMAVSFLGNHLRISEALEADAGGTYVARSTLVTPRDRTMKVEATPPPP